MSSALGTQSFFFAGEWQENLDRALSTVSQQHGLTGRILTKILSVSQEICARNCARQDPFSPPQAWFMFLQGHGCEMGYTRRGIQKKCKLGTYPFQFSFTFPKQSKKDFREYLQELPMLFSLHGFCRTCRDGGNLSAAPPKYWCHLTWPLEQPVSPMDLEQELGTISLGRLTMTAMSPPVTWANPRAQNKGARESDWRSKFQSCSQPKLTIAATAQMQSLKNRLHKYKGVWFLYLPF